MKKNLLLLGSLLMAMSTMGQEIEDVVDEKKSSDCFSIGLLGGSHINFTDYSDINEDIFSDIESQGSGILGFFFQYEWGKEYNFAVRPEFAFLSRNIKIADINGFYDGVKVKDYKLEAKYFDFRVPVIYNFGKRNISFRPYVYVAPVIGFVRDGEISLTGEYGDEQVEASMDLSKSNMASTYFAAAVGVGVKHSFALSHSWIDVGLEASYEYGFTDTFSNDEKDGKVQNVASLFSSQTKAKGNRKFSGAEIKVLISVPLSIFAKKKKPAPEPVIIPITPIVVKEEPVIVEEKPCYTLEEILDLADKKLSIEGKVICAVDVIHFDFGKSTLSKDSYEYLDKIAALINSTNIKMEIKGHTDNVGSKEFNMRLSQQRAKSVYDYLIKKGVDNNALSYSYYGMSRPLKSNETEEGRTMNRRVEFEISDNKK